MRTPLRLVKGRRWAKRSSRVAEFGRALVAGSWQTCNSCALFDSVGGSHTEDNVILCEQAFLSSREAAFSAVEGSNSSENDGYR